MQRTHGMLFSLIGMKFNGKFLEANNLYFGTEPQHGGKTLSGGVSLETGVMLFARNRNDGDMLSLGANAVVLWKMLLVL